MHREDAQRSTLRFGTCSIVLIMSYQEPITRLKDSIAVYNCILRLAIHRFGNSSILWNKRKDSFELVSFKIKEDTHDRLNEGDMQIIMREFSELSTIMATGEGLTTFEVSPITLISENISNFFKFYLYYFHEIYKTGIHFC